MIDLDDLDKPVENWRSVSIICFFTALLVFATFAAPKFWWGDIATGIAGEILGGLFLWSSGRVWRTNRVLRWWMLGAGVLNLGAPWVQFLAWLGNHVIFR